MRFNLQYGDGMEQTGETTRTALHHIAGEYVERKVLNLLVP